MLFVLAVATKLRQISYRSCTRDSRVEDMHQIRRKKGNFQLTWAVIGS